MPVMTCLERTILVDSKRPAWEQVTHGGLHSRFPSLPYLDVLGCTWIVSDIDMFGTEI